MASHPFNAYIIRSSERGYPHVSRRKRGAMSIASVAPDTCARPSRFFFFTAFFFTRFTAETAFLAGGNGLRVGFQRIADRQRFRSETLRSRSRSLLHFVLFFAAETKSRDVSRSKDVPNAGHDEAKAMAHSKRYIF